MSQKCVLLFIVFASINVIAFSQLSVEEDPYVKFDQPGFTGVLNYLKSQVITETKGVFTKINCTLDMAMNADPLSVKVFGMIPHSVVQIEDDKMRKKITGLINRNAGVPLNLILHYSHPLKRKTHLNLN